MAGIGERCRRDDDCFIPDDTLFDERADGLSLDGTLRTSVRCIDQVCRQIADDGTILPLEGGGGAPTTRGGECQPEGFPCSFYFVGGDERQFVEECCAGLVCDQIQESRFINLPGQTGEVNAFFGTCNRPPRVAPSPTPTPTPSPSPAIVTNTFALRLTSNIANAGTLSYQLGVESQGDASEIDSTPITNGVAVTWVSARSTLTVGILANPEQGYRFVRWNQIQNINLSSATTSELLVSLPRNVEVELEAVFERIEGPPPSPSPSRPAPSPSPSRVIQPQWRSCVDGKLYDGSPPRNYVRSTYTGPGNGTCWAPPGGVGFIPSLDNVSFDYKRGSGIYPTPLTFTAQNSSVIDSYRIKLITNTRYFAITPSEFLLGPNEEVTFEIRVVNDRDKVEEIADGTTAFELQVETTKI